MPQSQTEVYLNTLAQRQVDAQKLHRNLSVRVVCTALDISRSYFYSLLKRGLGPKVIKIGHRSFIPRDAFDEWVASFDEFKSKAA